jgi:uncharacterized protein
MTLKSRWGRIVVRWVKILAGLYVALLMVVFFCQRGMMYHPDRFSEEDSIKMAAGRGFVPWKNSAGAIIGWKLLAEGSLPHERVLIVHGNAGSALDRMDYAEGLRNAGAFDIYLLEYPGYGSRSGAASETSLYQAGDEAMGLLKAEGPVFLIGESLGTGVAAYLAGKFPGEIRGLLLIAPYNNMTDVAQHHTPIFPVRWLLRDKFPSAAYLEKYHGPVGVLLAGADEVVPNRFGRKLFDGYAGPKKLWLMPGVGHNDLQNQPPAWWQEAVNFWRINAK